MKIKNLINFKNIILRSKQISYLYYLLEDNYSKKKIIELLSGYILGFRFVKLSLNNNIYWKIRENIVNLTNNYEYIRFGRWNLTLFNLFKIHIPIKLFSLTSNILNTFLLKQYNYKYNDNIVIKEGDYILDAGGCWGDTALYFANKVGNSGKVYSFEFVSDNLNIFKKNLDLNRELSNIIKIVEIPLWKSSNRYLYVFENGPNSKISSETKNNISKKIKTITIDEYVRTNNIKKLNFIKMDIEGAELNALIGAKKVLIKHKPKLAISLYHNFEHFFKIPIFIKSLNLNYKFYLDHFTTHNEETILFAIVDNNFS